MKTAELTGPALRHAVMLAEGWTYFPATEYECAMYGRTGATPTWTASGPDYLTGPAGNDIIDREGISTTIDHSGVWIAYIMMNYADEERFMQAGPDRRTAAMRCWVASKFGAEVGIPRELRTQLAK